jgi:predicted nucleic acid-binding protein
MMYVADAHALGWYFTDDPQLGQEAARVFEASERGEYPILIPTIVLAELFHISKKNSRSIRQRCNPNRLRHSVLAAVKLKS